MLLESMSPLQIIFRAWVQARTMRLADVQMIRKLQSKHSVLPYAQDTSWDTMRQLDVSLQARQVGTILRPSARRRDKVLLMQSQRHVRRFPFCSSPSGATNPSCTGKLVSPHWQELIERIQPGMLSRMSSQTGDSLLLRAYAMRVWLPNKHATARNLCCRMLSAVQV